MDSSIISSLLTMVLATAFVLALAYGVLYLIRRSRLTDRLSGADKAGELTFLRAMPVGQRERLVVVRYQGAQLLLGVTGGAISLLQRDALSDTVPDAFLTTPPAVAEGATGQTLRVPASLPADPAGALPEPPNVRP
jgi:flagellar protein FliO/FliZ